MGWLEDLAKNTIYKYRCVQEPDLVIRGKAEELTELFGRDEPMDPSPGDKLTVAYWDDSEKKLPFFDLLDEEEVPYTHGDVWHFEYAGFEPKKLGIMTKITFEKNGRKALRVTHGDGKSHARSMTRENMYKERNIKQVGDKRDATGEKTGKKQVEVESTLTKACAEASNKAKANELGNRWNQMKKQVAAESHAAKQRSKK